MKLEWVMGSVSGEAHARDWDLRDMDSDNHIPPRGRLVGWIGPDGHAFIRDAKDGQPVEAGNFAGMDIEQAKIVVQTMVLLGETNGT